MSVGEDAPRPPAALTRFLLVLLAAFSLAACALVSPTSVPRGVPCYFTIALTLGSNVTVYLVNEDITLKAEYDIVKGAYVFYTPITVHEENVIIKQGNTEVGHSVVLTYDPFCDTSEIFNVPESTGGYYGSIIAMDEEWIVLGDEESENGSVVLYHKATLGWSMVGEYTIAESNVPLNITALVLYNDILVIGAQEESKIGHIYICQLSVQNGLEKKNVLGDDFAKDSLFGYSVDILETLVLVGAPGIGETYLYDISDLTNPRLLYTFSDPAQSELFGKNVAIGESHVFVIGSVFCIYYYVLTYTNGEGTISNYASIDVTEDYTMGMTLNYLVVGEPSMGNLSSYKASLTTDTNENQTYKLELVDMYSLQNTGLGTYMSTYTYGDIVSVVAPNYLDEDQNEGAMLFFAITDKITVIQQATTKTASSKLGNPVALYNTGAVTRLYEDGGILLINTDNSGVATISIELSDPSSYSFSNRNSLVEVVLTMKSASNKIIRETNDSVVIIDEGHLKDKYEAVYDTSKRKFVANISLPYGFQPHIRVEVTNNATICRFLPSVFVATPSSGVSKIFAFPDSVVKNTTVTFLIFLLNKNNRVVEIDSSDVIMTTGVEPVQLYPTTKDEITGGYITSEFKISSHSEAYLYCMINGNPYVATLQTSDATLEPWVIIVITVLSISLVGVTVSLILIKVNVKCKRKNNKAALKDSGKKSIYTPLWL